MPSVAKAAMGARRGATSPAVTVAAALNTCWLFAAADRAVLTTTPANINCGKNVSDCEVEKQKVSHVSMRHIFPKYTIILTPSKPLATT